MYMSRKEKYLGHGSKGDKLGITVLMEASSNLTDQPTELISCEMAASQQRCKHESRRISGVWNCNVANALMFGAVICSVCRSMQLLQLPVVISVKSN